MPGYVPHVPRMLRRDQGPVGEIEMTEPSTKIHESPVAELTPSVVTEALTTRRARFRSLSLRSSCCLVNTFGSRTVIDDITVDATLLGFYNHQLPHPLDTFASSM